LAPRPRHLTGAEPITAPLTHPTARAPALVAAGLSTEVAVAAVLMDQLVASFIPAVPGWFATNDLLKRDYL
jgi:hypothetical protein